MSDKPHIPLSRLREIRLRAEDDAAPWGMGAKGTRRYFRHAVAEEIKRINDAERIAQLEAENAQLTKWEDVKTYSLQCNLNLGQGKRKIVELYIDGKAITMRDSDDHEISIYAPNIRIQRRIAKEGDDEH